MLLQKLMWFTNTVVFASQEMLLQKLVWFLSHDGFSNTWFYCQTHGGFTSLLKQYVTCLEGIEVEKRESGDPLLSEMTWQRNVH